MAADGMIRSPGGPGRASFLGQAPGPRLQRSPAWLKLLVLLLGLYALLPSLAVPPVATEGFEAAVSSGVNQAIFAPSAVPFPLYNYDSRPGEFWLYRFTARLIPVDALLIGQVWSFAAYAGALAGVILLAVRTGIAGPWATALAVFCLFDLASNMAQVSSSNLATGLLALGAGLFATEGVAAAIGGTLLLAAAVFCRLDMLVMVPFALLFSALSHHSFPRWLLRCVIAGLCVGALAMALYAASGLSIPETLRANKGVALAWNIWALRHSVHMISLWTLVPAALGVTLGQFGTWRRQLLLALARAFAIMAPTATIVAVYLGQMDTPRFIAPAAIFLALGTAMLIEAIAVAPRRARAAATALVLLAAAASWTARRPLEIWDGYRWMYATYLAPYEMWREKRHFDASNPGMVADALELSCDACQKQSLAVLSIDWRQFNEFMRQLVLRGATLTEVGKQSLAGRPAHLRYRFDFHGRAVTTYLFERPREFKEPASAVQAIDELAAGSRVTVLLSDASLMRAILAAEPNATATSIARYDVWPEHLSVLNMHRPSLAR